MSTTRLPQIPLIVIPTVTNFRRFCQYAAPIFFTILGKSVVYNGVAMSVGRLGAVALAAHQVLLRSFFFWTPVGDSVGMTSQVFLPGILAEERRTGTTQTRSKATLVYGWSHVGARCCYIGRVASFQRSRTLYDRLGRGGGTWSYSSDSCSQHFHACYCVNV